jgi:hypothetical protein
MTRALWAVSLAFDLRSKVGGMEGKKECVAIADGQARQFVTASTRVSRT